MHLALAYMNFIVENTMGRVAGVLIRSLPHTVNAGEFSIGRNLGIVHVRDPPPLEGYE